MGEDTETPRAKEAAPKFRIVANENLPEEAIVALRERGHDVVWLRTEAPGSPDPLVLARAHAERRLVLTWDKGFGELAFHAHLPASSGVLLFRVPPRSGAQVARVVVGALESRADWAGHFAVIEEARIRMTPLPEAAPVSDPARPRRRIRRLPPKEKDS